MPTRIFVMIAILGLLFTQGATAEQDIEARALKLEGQLMAPCCYGGTVAGHDSGIVRQMREEIRTRMGQGMTDQQILDGYVAQFGERVLAAPPSRGFHLMAYALPPTLLILALFVVIMVLRRFREQPEPASVDVDPERLAQIERELQKQQSTT